MAEAARGAAELDELAAKRAKKKAAPLAVAESHQAYALELIDDLAAQAGRAPVYTEGELWIPDGALWGTMHQRVFRNRAAKLVGHRKLASTQRALVQIGERVCDLTFDPTFFAEAPVGVATPSRFWTLRDGELVDEVRSADQRQRFELPVEPAFADNGEPDGSGEWDRFLYATFDGPDRDAQIGMLQEVFGGVLFGLLAALQRVVLLIGVTRSGKGTVARVLESMLPTEAVCSVAPVLWGHEYYRAALAGKRLNLVGETDETRAIPSGEFKSVTGLDLVGGRHPNHAAFTFRCDAAHVFSGNAFPAARDRDDAFYQRWALIEFRNSVAGREDSALAARLVRDELPAILAWALVGAARLASRGRLPPSATHDRLIEQWRVEHSSVLTWLLDPDAVELLPDRSTPRREVFESFRAWLRMNGRAPLSSHTLYSDLRRFAGRYGVEEVKTRNGWVFRGLVPVGPNDLMRDV